MDLPTMIATETETTDAVPAVEAKTFDKYWLDELTITAPDVNGADATVNGVLQNYRDVDGGKEAGTGRVSINIPNAFALAGERVAAGKPALAQALGALLLAIKEYGMEQGIIAE